MQAPSINEPVPFDAFPISAPRSPAEHDRSIIQAAPPAVEPQRGAMRRFFGMIGRRFPTILIVTALAIAGALGALRFMTPLYTVSAQVMIQRIEAPGASRTPDDSQRALHNEEQLIVSTPVLASALSLPDIHNISSLRGRPDALKLVKQQLHVDSGKSDDLLDVSYDCANPREGTQLVAAVVDSYVRFRSGVHETSINGSAATVLAEKQKATDSLTQKRAELQKFSNEHGLALGNEEVDAADEALHQLGVKLAQARVDLIASRAAYDQMQHDLAEDPRMRDRLAQSKENDSSLAGGDDQLIARQICVLETQLAGYGTKFMANYEPVQLLHRKIDDLKFTRDAIIQQRWQAAVRTEAELGASFTQEENTATLSEANKQVFDQHKADVAEADKQVGMLDKQLKDLESANKLITTMVTVIEPATASDRPTKPRSDLILLVAALAGLSLGIGVGAIRDVRSEEKITSKSKTLGAGLPLLARLPAVPRRQLAMNSWRDRVVDSAAEFAEACCTLHDALEGVTSFSGGRTVLITSTNAHEGKSTLASLLALTLAQTEKRVLLVDANLYAPAQGHIFGIEGDYGLGQLLEEEIESSFVSYVHPGTDPRMDILLSGSAEMDIPDLLNSQRFTNLMAAMAAEYDYVLIDSPPLAMGADARIISSACDATIVLASESSVNRKALSKTRDSLTSVGGNVIGVVLNGGMAAISSQPALVNIELPTPARAAFKAPVNPPVQVTTVRLSPAVEPVQSVVAAQVRRAPETEPELEDPAKDDERFSWIWSYAFFLALLVGSWMAFHATWGASPLHGVGAAGRPSILEPIVSTREEPVAILMAGAGLLVVMLIAGFHVRPPRHEIALMVLGGALGGWSIYGGRINTLWSAQQHGVIISAATQAILLFASLILAWSFVRRMTVDEATNLQERPSIADVALAVFANSSVMSALMILLSHWQTKGESLAVIAFASCMSAMLAYWISPLRSSFCFWLSALIVALFGGLCAMLNARGIHTGILLSLARPLPMDYASMGPIGAVLGYWIARSARQVARPMPLAVE